MEPAIPANSAVRLFDVADDTVLQRGDLVVVPSRSISDIELVRRIVGLPGEEPDPEVGWLARTTGDPSAITGRSPVAQRSDLDGFGYVVAADNPDAPDGSVERYTHDEIRLWAPSDTTALPPLSESERMELVGSLTMCVEEAGVEAPTLSSTSVDVLNAVFEVVVAQDPDEATWAVIADCLHAHAELDQ